MTVCRVLSRNESGQVAELHFRAFNGFFLTSLGKPFLKIFYKSIIEHPEGIAVGVFNKNKLVAFAIGTKCKSGFYTKILEKRMLAMGWAALPQLVSKPAQILKLFISLKSAVKLDEGKSASLLSICVSPDEEGNGLGKMVLKAFEEIAFVTSPTISLTTDFVDNGYVNTFYQNNSYELYGVFLQAERKMNLYLKKRKMIIPFSPPFVDEHVIAEVVDTLKSGWITTGPKVKALEQEVITLTNCPEALCVNSWTSGAILVLKWFGVGPGDEVIIPAYTYSATALSVLHCGATPVMVDVLDDFTVDPKQVKSAITERTKIIMPVDFAGLMCHYDQINAIVKDENVVKLFKSNSEKQKALGRILIVSDAAHSIGASLDHIQSGNATDISIFSFHAVKNVTTAEGGVICINLPSPFYNSEEYKLMRLWSLNGQTKDAFTKSQAGGWKYDILFAGLKVNMPDLCAALGLGQIRQYGELLNQRYHIAKHYESFFTKKSWAKCPRLADEKRISCNHLYALRINEITEFQRDQMIEFITKEGVAVNVHFVPMPMLTVFKDLGYKIEDYPISYANYASEISLPIYPQLTEEQVNFICNTVENAYRSLF